MNDNDQIHLSMNSSIKHSDSNDLVISKETLSNGCEYTKFTNKNPSSNRRKLILHFDNRNTLQVSGIIYRLEDFLFSLSLDFQGCK